MKNSDKETAVMLTQALEVYGVREAVTSPGSRNAPLVVAAQRCGALRLRTVIDERSAAFIALGIAQTSMRPVALICTSGTALLNYAPAVAEAYYRKTPLIVISADRPARWIGQDDSQTLPQPGILDKITVMSVTLPPEMRTHDDFWLTNRRLNEALQQAVSGRPGPVHINVPLAEPLGGECEEKDHPFRFRKIDLMLPEKKLGVTQARALAEEIHGKKILIAGGFCPPSAEVSKAMAKLSTLADVVIAADALANLNCPGIVERPDLMDFDALLLPPGRPDILITFGGALLSRKLKEFLRLTDFEAHWHIGTNDMLIDSYFSLTRRIEIAESDFFPRLANAMLYLSGKGKKSSGGGGGVFRAVWHEAASRAEADYRLRTESAGWDGRSAVAALLAELPSDWNLQLSNGLTVRYAVNSGAARFHRRDCNRGVSGIDGSASTALGASLAFKGTTLFLSGDMSMQYDLGALSCNYLTPRLKIAVINNGGGGIFRKVESTRNLPELEERFVCRTNLPLEELARAYGLEYFRATSEEELREVLPRFRQERLRPCLLEIIVPDK